MNTNELQTTLEQLKEKYEKGIIVYTSLVGTLYPSIYYKELLQTREEYIKIGGEDYDIPYLYPPRENGSAPLRTQEVDKLARKYPELNHGFHYA
jgi:hypothetical protein